MAALTARGGGFIIEATEREEPTMAWSLKGQLIESCSCNMFCPCWFGVPDLMIMDQGWCTGVLALEIEEGESEGVDLGGRSAVLSAHFPGPTMFDGGGTGRIYVDDGASDEQRQQLETILQGQVGGPMEAVAGLIATWLPTQTASIETQSDDGVITVSAGDAGQLKSTLLRDPEGNTFHLDGGGFVAGFGYTDGVELAPTIGSQWSDSDLPVADVETKSGARGAVAWAA
jgi:hypothetical protein